jgi:hypothetical protein
MTDKKSIKASEMKVKLRYLTASMVLMLVLYPFLEVGTTQTILMVALISAMCFFGVYAICYDRRYLTVSLALCLIWFISTWVTVFDPTPLPTVVYINIISLMLFYLFTATIILSFVLRSSEIGGDVLYGAISVYFLVGGVFCQIYVLIETWHPGSFCIAPAYNIDGVVNWSDFIYYSFTTLTTLGYGDVIPVTSQARSFSVLEAIIGVMYLAIIISRLVGMYISRSKIK